MQQTFMDVTTSWATRTMKSQVFCARSLYKQMDHLVAIHGGMFNSGISYTFLQFCIQ